MEQRELKPGGASIPVTRYVVFLKFIYSEEATKFWEIFTFHSRKFRQSKGQILYQDSVIIN